MSDQHRHHDIGAPPQPFDARDLPEPELTKCARGITLLAATLDQHGTTLDGPAGRERFVDTVGAIARAVVYAMRCEACNRTVVPSALHTGTDTVIAHYRCVEHSPPVAWVAEVSYGLAWRGDDGVDVRRANAG